MYTIFHRNRCTELKEIIAAATNSSLADKFVTTHGRPIITSGEVHPTDIVPVIALLFSKLKDTAFFRLNGVNTA